MTTLFPTSLRKLTNQSLMEPRGYSKLVSRLMQPSDDHWGPFEDEVIPSLSRNSGLPRLL